MSEAAPIPVSIDMTEVYTFCVEVYTTLTEGDLLSMNGLVSAYEGINVILDEASFVSTVAVDASGTAIFKQDVTFTENVASGSVVEVGITQSGSGGAVFSGPDGNPATVTGGDIKLTASVPEPSSTALLGLGGMALILRRRK